MCWSGSCGDPSRPPGGRWRKMKPNRRYELSTKKMTRPVKEQVRSLLRLVARIQASNGEWTVSTLSGALEERILPTDVAVVEFDSATLFRLALNRNPQNQFNVTLDFSRSRILDLTNPSESPTPNRSKSAKTA